MIKQKILFIAFLIFYFVILVKLFFLQVINPYNSSNDLYLQTNKILPERGKIYDVNGLPLAVNNTSYLLYLEPKQIEDKSYLISKLDTLLGMDEASLEAKIDPAKNWVAVQGNISSDLKQKILDLGLKGLGFQDEYQRYYPESSLAAHLLGFVGKDEKGNNVGYFGVEGFFDQDLTGLPGVLKSDRDILGRPILIGTQQKLDPENGRDLYLNLDKSVQDIVKKKLAAALDTYKAKDGCVIVVNPMTMEIIALSCLPDFDVEHYYRFTEDYFKDPAISNLYEPGSIFKPLIMAAALQEKKVKPDDIYDETGPVNVYNYTIRTWDNKYEGKITMTRILEKSSNVGMVYVGQKLGNNKLYAYLNKYGFGQLTNIDLQGEVSGYLKPESDWYPIDFATVTFGQGIAVTPIQMVRAFSAIVNGGKLLQPIVVHKIVSADKDKVIAPKLVRQIISRETSDTIKKMLVSTVDNGEVKWAKPKGYTIGGKTGTAQIPIQGKYDPEKTLASFMGFAPANNPKFLALVFLREPQTSPWGSETAAPLFFDIAKELLVYYNIAPDQ